MKLVARIDKIPETDLFSRLVLNTIFLHTIGTSQGLKLTLNVETEEYMSGPASGSGAFVSTNLFKYSPF